LIVDDSPLNLKLARVLLEREGYAVRTASDGLEVLTLLDTWRPGLILMDIQMPGMDGLTLTRRLKADAATRHIVVLALTAYAMKDDRQKALEAGCDGYISKPIDTRALPLTIREYLEIPVSSDSAEKANDCADNSGILDRASLLTRVDGDADLLSGLVDLFMSEFPKDLLRIRGAIVSGDARSLEAAGHAYKGVLETLSAKAAAAVALQLELMGREGDLTRAADALAALEKETDRLLPVLETLKSAQAESSLSKARPKCV
jgi:CheY-like chemotaxis protein